MDFDQNWLIDQEMEKYVQIGKSYVKFDNIKSLGSRLSRPDLFTKLLRTDSRLTTNSLCMRTQYWFAVQGITNLNLQSEEAKVKDRSEYEGHTFFRVHTKTHPKVRLVFTWPENMQEFTIHLSNYQQAPQDMITPSLSATSGLQISRATNTNLHKRHINLIILIPPVPEIFDTLHNILTDESLGFQFEAGSNKQWLYSRQQHYDWFVLLFPYHDGQALQLRQYLNYASETILCLFEPNQTDLVIVSQILHENQCLLQTSPQKAHLSAMFDSTPCQLKGINIEAHSTFSAVKAALQEMTPQSLAVGVVQATFNAGSICKLQRYLISWLATPVFTMENIYVCFRFEQLITTPFTETRQKIIDAIHCTGISTELLHINCVVHGSILAYVSCPTSMIWHLMTLQDKLINEFQLHHLKLISIHEATISDIDDSMTNKDNANLQEELMELKQVMIRDGVKTKLHNRVIYPQPVVKPVQQYNSPNTTIFSLMTLRFNFITWVLDSTCSDQDLIHSTVRLTLETEAYKNTLISVMIAPHNITGPFINVSEALKSYTGGCTGGDSKLRDAVKKSAQSLKELKGHRAVFITTDKPSHMVAKEIEELKKNDIFVAFLSFGGSRDLCIADMHVHIPSEQYLEQMRLRWQELQVHPRLELQQRLENQVVLQLHWAHSEVSAAHLLIHTQHNWKQVRAAPLVQSNQKKTSVTFHYDGLLEDTEYPFKGELVLCNGQKVSSKLLTVQTRKHTPLGKLFMDPLRVDQECKNAKEFISWFSGRLRHMIRIGLIGKNGSGKSTVFNSLTSIFSGQLQMTNTAGISPALVRKTKLELIDMFGWELQGRLTTHYENDLQSLMDGCASDSLFPRETLQRTDRRKWYGAIFCVSPEEIDNPEELQYIQDLYEMCQSRGLCPVVFLTSCDRIDPEVKERPELIYRSDAIEGYINKLGSKVISSQHIFPVLSYFDYRVANKVPLDPIKNCTLLIAFRALLENMKSALTDVLPDEPKPEPPKDKSPEPFYVLARRKGDTPFRRCLVPDRNISSLKDALKAKFNLEIAPTMIQEWQSDNNNNNVNIEHDNDVLNLKNEAYLEFS